MEAGKVVFLTRTIEPEAQNVFLEEAPAGWQVTVVEPNQGAQVVEQIEDADFLVTYRSGRVPESILPHAKQLKLIQVKRIAGAGIDVFDPEPPDPKNSLLHMDNVIATPHMGATSWENWEL
jgi:phosphoglycerate dehydrogenase-like enzyme